MNNMEQVNVSIINLRNTNKLASEVAEPSAFVMTHLNLPESSGNASAIESDVPSLVYEISKSVEL